MRCTLQEIDGDGFQDLALVHLDSFVNPGRVSILMGDGAVIFMTDSVEGGDQRHQMVWLRGTGGSAPGSQSPYGLWGALGTRASKEPIDEALNQ